MNYSPKFRLCIHHAKLMHKVEWSRFLIEKRKKKTNPSVFKMYDSFFCTQLTLYILQIKQ